MPRREGLTGVTERMDEGGGNDGSNGKFSIKKAKWENNK